MIRHGILRRTVPALGKPKGAPAPVYSPAIFFLSAVMLPDPANRRLQYLRQTAAAAQRRAKVATLDAEISRIQAELDSLETAIAGVSDVSAPTPSLEPAFGERRQIDGSWATWGSFYAGGKPGWVYDQ